jgi:hypothetical protein
MKLLAWPVLVAALALAVSGCNQQEAKKAAVPDEFGFSPANATIAEKEAQTAKIRAETKRLKAKIDAMDPQGRAARIQAEAEEQAKADAYFSPSWTAFQADRGRYFSVIVDGVSN